MVREPDTGMRRSPERTGVSVWAGSPAPTHAWHIARTALALLFAVAALTFALALEPSPLGRAFAAMEDENLVDPTQRADNSFIYDTTIESLFNQSSLYDNRTVQVVGEAIGDRISARHDQCWVTLTVVDSEDKSTISVLMSNDQANQIDRFGKYGVTGTILQVRGTYHQACNDHEGLPDIHATNSSVMSKGIDHPDRLDAGSFAPGVLTIIVGFALMAAFYFARERMR